MDWLRLYVRTLDNPKVQVLPGRIFKAWVNCLCLARMNDGVLPPLDAIAFRLRCSARQAERWLDDLEKRKLVDVMPDGTYEMHDWDEHQYVSDGSTKRVQKHREKHRRAVSRNVSVTPPDTEQIQSRTETQSDTEPDTPRDEVRPIRQQRIAPPSGVSPNNHEPTLSMQRKEQHEIDRSKEAEAVESDVGERTTRCRCGYSYFEGEEEQRCPECGNHDPMQSEPLIRLAEVTKMLYGYVQECHLPWSMPDQKICRKTLASAGGSVAVLHQVLRSMFLDKHLKPSKSYGWFPVTVASQQGERKTA